ncbi:unnamed protein product [Soboliphyme baturini]|uniref:ATP-dependent DNA helicase 2 subunit 1 n=1 Tax=Soboliphyme baturini TaxID=241478 RepID=A0A183IGD6_9BILA|nr:unnamed protein product [Soboliphyme baturini]
MDPSAWNFTVDEEEENFDQVVLNTYSNKCSTCQEDYLSVILFNTAKDRNDHGFKNIYVLHQLALPGAETVKELEGLLQSSSENDFSKLYGHGACNMDELFWVAGTLFSSCKLSEPSKTVLLLTDNDNPHRSDLDQKLVNVFCIEFGMTSVRLIHSSVSSKMLLLDVGLAVLGVRYFSMFHCAFVSHVGVRSPGLVLIGFKPITLLKPYHHVRSALFIYPNDTVEEYDDHGDQICPSGFHVIFLPFADDLRDLSMIKSEPRPNARAHHIQMAEEIVDRLTIDYDAEKILNPVLQKHYKVVEAYALERQETEEVPDHTSIDQLQQCTVAALKDMCARSGMKLQATRKADIIQEIKDHYGV